MSKFKGVSTDELRAEVHRRDERSRKRQVKRWRDENRCRREDCDEPLRSLSSEILNEVSSGYGIAPTLIAVEYGITEICDAGHETYRRETHSMAPPREREVSVKAKGKPYEGPVVVRYWRHFVEHSAEEDDFVEAWHDWQRASDAGEIYLHSFEKPDGTTLWEMPNPFDGWIRRSPDAPPLPERDDD